MKPVEIGYTNYRGVYSVRRIIPLRLEYRESIFHGPGKHHIMVSFDCDKQDVRDFLVKDIGFQ